MKIIHARHHAPDYRRRARGSFEEVWDKTAPKFGEDGSRNEWRRKGKVWGIWRLWRWRQHRRCDEVGENVHLKLRAPEVCMLDILELWIGEKGAMMTDSDGLIPVESCSRIMSYSADYRPSSRSEFRRCRWQKLQ